MNIFEIIFLAFFASGVGVLTSAGLAYEEMKDDINNLGAKKVFKKRIVCGILLLLIAAIFCFLSKLYLSR